MRVFDDRFQAVRMELRSILTLFGSGREDARNMKNFITE
jgi:hypothetical protein